MEFKFLYSYTKYIKIYKKLHTIRRITISTVRQWSEKSVNINNKFSKIYFFSSLLRSWTAAQQPQFNGSWNFPSASLAKRWHRLGRTSNLAHIYGMFFSKLDVAWSRDNALRISAPPPFQSTTIAGQPGSFSSNSNRILVLPQPQLMPAHTVARRILHL